MKFQFDSKEEYEILWQAVHDGIIYWKKVRQMCQGKINMNVNGEETHYDEQFAIDMMVEQALLLEKIEKSPHPIWNEESQAYELGVDEYGSSIVNKCKKLIPKVDI